MQAASETDAAPGEELRRLVTVKSFDAQGEDSALTVRLPGKELQLLHAFKLRERKIQKLPLRAHDLPDAVPGNILHPGKQSRDAGDIVRPGLEPVGQIVRHLLQKAVGTRPAGQKRLAALPAQEQSGPLRPEKALVSRHGDKGRAQLFKIHRQYPRRLGRVHDQGHAFPFAQGRDFIDGQDKAEDVGDHRAHDKLRMPDLLLKGAQAGSAVEKRRFGDDDLCAESLEGPRDGVVLIAGYQYPCARLCQRADRNVEAMGRVHGKHHIRRVRHMKQLCRLFTAAVYQLRRPHGGSVSAAARTCAGAHGQYHGAGNGRRLDQRCGRVVKIDHVPPPPDSCRHPRAHRPCRSGDLRF